MKKSIFISVFVLAEIFCSAQSGSITVTSVNQRTDGSGYVDVYFNLSGPGSTYKITMQASFDGGSTYTSIPPAFLSGDVAGINPGSNKHIVWDGLGSFPNTFSTQARLKLTTIEVTGSSIPCPGMPTFTDTRDGQTYNTVQIGSQCWMKGNLKYLPSVVGSDTGSNTVPYFYVYSYNGTDVTAAKATANFQNYGALYNWPASLTACPPGWHLPSDDEWTQLTNYMIAQGFPNSDVINGAGNALKSCRQVNSPLGGGCKTTKHPYWSIHANHGFDKFGFSALPGGIRATYLSWAGITTNGLWWSSTGSSPTSAWSGGIVYDYGGAYRGSGDIASGYSVRCLRD